MKMKMKKVVSAGSLLIATAAVLLVAKGFVRLPMPRTLSLGRFSLEGKNSTSSGIPKGKGCSDGMEAPLRVPGWRGAGASSVLTPCRALAGVRSGVLSVALPLASIDDELDGRFDGPGGCRR